ncbi:unnamed protein product [Rotaria sordida]|uniref:Uncharacterized protein n=1 Tax=Rotaria sordida TaxID=392033 RepID=A0A813ZL49_9BILA|nr:unnamed protein product [Rotaria sordida]CAF0906520.1 unnamed protein product [Rotaria sordida]
MPTIDFTGCLSTYWFVWSINGFGSILGLTINMIVSFVFLKHIGNLAKGKPSVPKNRKKDFSMYRNTSPTFDTPVDPWAPDPTMGNIFATSNV